MNKFKLKIFNEKLKDNYTYVSLINEVYTKSFSVNIGLNESILKI